MIYYHNPKCSKSRQGLEIVKKSGIDFTIKEYLKEPMTLIELENLFSKLAMEPADAVRTKESIYIELNLAKKTLSSKEWMGIIIENPKLLERPILLGKNKAVVGRPPENLLKLLK